MNNYFRGEMVKTITNALDDKRDIVSLLNALEAERQCTQQLRVENAALRADLDLMTKMYDALLWAYQS